MSRQLIIDTSKNFILLGLVDEKKFVFKSIETSKSVSMYLMNEIIKFLDENSCDKNSLNSVCCGVGPGSFTGIRLALTIAKTFSYALNIPIYSISSLQLYTLFVSDLNVIVVDDARSEKLYYCKFNKQTLEYLEDIDEDVNVVDFCKLNDNYIVISHIEFSNISSQVITDFSKFDLDLYYKLITLDNCFTLKPKYIKKI